MIEYVKLENFRGFDSLELSKIRPVTLISGKNNVGKSSILEGIFLFLDHVSADSFGKLSRFRGLQPMTDAVGLWEPVFYQMDMNKTLKMEMTIDGAASILEYEKDLSFVPANDVNVPYDVMSQMVASARSAYTLKLRYLKGDYMEDGHFVVSPAGVLRNINTTLEYNQVEMMPYTHYINSVIVNIDGAITEWFGKLELSGKKQQIIDVLRILDPKISDLSTIAVNGQVMLYAKMDEQLLPIKLAGDGLNKLLFIILSIISNPHSILLIDEIEGGFHYSMYAKLWEILAQTAHAHDCQIIATTHSYECIVGAVDGIASAGLGTDFCYFRIDRNGNKNRAYYYTDELLRTAVAADMEVR